MKELEGLAFTPKSVTTQRGPSRDQPELSVPRQQISLKVPNPIHKATCSRDPGSPQEDMQTGCKCWQKS